MLNELTAHLALVRPGTLLDAGAHAGAFTLHFAEVKHARVVAFEPLPDVSEALRQELRRRYGGNIPAHVQVHSVALGDRPGRATLSIPKVRGDVVKEWASIAKDFEEIRAALPQGFDEIIHHEVDVWTIDSLALRDVTAMKIDVEGHELAVVRGATTTIRACRPFITLELEERHSAGCTWSVPAYLDALDYDGFFAFQDTLYPISALIREKMHRASTSPAVREYSDPYIFEYYFVPRECFELREKLIALAAGGYQERVDPARLGGR